jgi:antitoxin HicB
VNEATPPEVPVRFYRTNTGREPVREWLRGLEEGDRRAIGLDLMRVQFGWPIGMPRVRSLKDGLWEVRSSLPKPADCAAGALLSRRDADRAPWVHQKDAEDCSGRLGVGETKDERGDEMKKQNKHVGSSLDEFLKEEGILEEARTIAIKEAVAWQVRQAMLKDNITKVEMARRMHTSRAALDRLLDPGNGAVTLQTLSRAANAIGRGLRIELV